MASYRDHLDPGGRLAVTMYVPGDDDMTGFGWRLRRTGTDAAGVTYVVHEATGLDGEPQVQLVYNRVETYDADGALVGTVLRKHRLRWWTRRQFADALTAAGFVDIEMVGDDSAWVTLATRP